MTRIDTLTAKSSGACAMPAAGVVLAQARTQACAVRLIDRRTGHTPKRNGQPLVIISRSPDEAVALLMDGRDPAIWLTEIEPIHHFS